MFKPLGWYRADEDEFYPYPERVMSDELRDLYLAAVCKLPQGQAEIVELSTGRIKVWYPDGHTGEYPDFDIALTAAKLRI